MSLVTLKLEDYLAQLASEAGTPGGGAAAALTGAQAAALLSMTARISGSPSPRLLSALDARRQKLVDLADRDGVAFGAVMSAMKLPRATDLEKATRSTALDLALRAATDVPLALMAELDTLIDEAGEVIATAKASVVSDAGIAVELAAAAIRASRFNVDVNLVYLKDPVFAESVEKSCDALLDGLKVKRKTLTAAVKVALKR